MPVQWQSTGFPGVRFYKHPNRKHGVKYDRYFAIRYQHDGKRREEGLGWSSEGWTAEKAFKEICFMAVDFNFDGVHPDWLCSF